MRDQPYIKQIEEAIQEGFESGDIDSLDSYYEWVRVFIGNSVTYESDNWQICIDMQMTKFGDAKDLEGLAYLAWNEAFMGCESYDYYRDEFAPDEDDFDEDAWQTEADQIGERLI